MKQTPHPRPARRLAIALACGAALTPTIWAQQAQTSSTPAPSNDRQVPVENKAPSKDETLELSPFVVSTQKDQGYFAENTLAGSRMRTNISDLASSISVITKQQMDDTASVDINDVFRYEINTEGSSTYTPGVQSLRSDGVADTNAGVSVGGGAVQTNATSNRVRGIGVPSTAINYYPSIGQIPFDTYNIQSLEISRGPNSMLFGMGSPAGIVNQTTAQAVLNRNSANVTFRVDDRNSKRASFSFNKALIEDKLSIYGAFLYSDQQFERKPSYDITRRQYGAFTYKPFSKTTIRGNVEGYTNNNRRPNTLTPRDFVTQWNLAGKPVYDPLTRKITKSTTGEVVGVYVLDAASPFANDARAFIESRPNFDATKWNPAKTTYNGISIFGEAALTNINSILYVPGITWANQARSTMQISNGTLMNWFQPLGNQQYRTVWGTPADPSANADLYPIKNDIWANNTWSDVFNRYYTSSNGWTNNGTNLGGYKYAGVTDKSIYDWEKINVNQMNFGSDKNTNYNLELEQEITKDLFLSAGFFRQDFNSVSNYTVAQLNVATLFVDTNKNLPDGSLNPFFGEVYVEDTDPDQAISGEKHDHYRAMLAYTPDFTQKDGWLKYLGRHQILGLWSQQNSMVNFTRKRLQYIDGSQAGKYRYMANPNDKAGVPTGWNYQTTSLRRAYYLANPNGPQGVVAQGSGEWDYQKYTGNIRVYDYANSRFDTVNMTTEFTDFDASTGRTERKLDSWSAGVTSYFWDERLITTLGLRHDAFKARGTTNAAIYRQELSTGDTTKDVGYDGKFVVAGRPVPIVAPMTNPQKWVNGIYQTDTVSNRWNRWDELTGDTKTIGGVIKPFKNRPSIDRRAGSGSLFWELVQNFGLSYNRSDNFNAPAAAQVDGFGVPLPKPTGKGTDYGFQFSALQNKLFARVTWFDATNNNERTNPGTSISRLTLNMDTTLFRNWARTIAKINMGLDPRTAAFDNALSATQETAVQAAAETIWKQSYTYYDGLNIGATRNASAKGAEIQINYNPTRNWTMKLTGGKQTTIYNDVLKEFDGLYAERNPIWQAAKATDYLLPAYQGLTTYTSSGGRPVNLTNFWTSYGFDSNVRLDEPNGNYDVATYYSNVVGTQAALARDLNGQAAPGQRRYRGSFLTNYTFDRGMLQGFSVGGSQRWEDRAVIGYLGKASGTNLLNPALIDVSDTTKPVYDSDNWYTDVWVSYARKILRDKVRMKLQLNVADVFENGGLKVTAVNYDGSPYAYRIVDSRQFILSASFDF